MADEKHPCESDDTSDKMNPEERLAWLRERVSLLATLEESFTGRCFHNARLL